jgi:hypothetical protein
MHYQHEQGRPWNLLHVVSVPWTSLWLYLTRANEISPYAGDTKLHKTFSTENSTNLKNGIRKAKHFEIICTLPLFGNLPLSYPLIISACRLPAAWDRPATMRLGIRTVYTCTLLIQ